MLNGRGYVKSLYRRILHATVDKLQAEKKEVEKN